MHLDEEQQPILNFSQNYEEPSEVDSSLQTRLRFIKKVYLIIDMQILFAGILSLFQIKFRNKQEIEELEYSLFTIVALVAFFLMCFLLCKKRFARKTPINYILLIIYTLTFGFVISEICFFFYLSYEIQNNLIYIAILMTFTIITTLTIFALTTKANYSYKKNFQWSFLLCLFQFSIFYYMLNTNQIQIFCISLAIFLHSAYIINGIKQIFDKKRHSLQKDDYMLGALFLNIDIVYIFSDLFEYFEEQLWKKK